MQKLNFDKAQTNQTKYEYDFFKDGVTQSLIQTFLRCPRQCKLAYVDGWEVNKKANYFAFGDCAHYMLENILKHGKLPTRLLIDQYLDKWFEKNSQDGGDVYELNEIMVQVKAIMEVYFMKYCTDIFKKWYALELEFEVPYTYKDGLTIPLRGKIDMIETLEDGSLALYDTKTTSSWSKEHTLLLLPVDFQLNFYLYVLSLQENISAVYYNVIKKPTHKRGKLDDDGFYDKLKNAYSEDLDKYFIRELVPINSQSVGLWKEEFLDPIMLQMRTWAESKYEYPGYYNPLALENKYGLTSFARMLLFDTEAGYHKKEKVNPELGDLK